MDDNQFKFSNAVIGLPVFFVPAPLGQRATEKYPQVFENYYRFRDREITVSKGDKHLRIQSMLGDSTLISMFGFEVVHGFWLDAELAVTVESVDFDAARFDFVSLLYPLRQFPLRTHVDDAPPVSMSTRSMKSVGITFRSTAVSPGMPATKRRPLSSTSVRLVPRLRRSTVETPAQPRMAATTISDGSA